MSEGQLTVRGVVSWTVTLNLQLPELLWVSVAEQVTTVVPMAKVLPLAGTQVTVSVPSTISLALALKVATAPDGPVASLVMSEGQLTVGGVVSWTMTLNLQSPELLWASVAEQVTTVVPMAKGKRLAEE